MKNKLSPAKTVLLGFLMLILFGTFLLQLPIATPGSGRAHLIDSFFTATSAICVTGLVVVDTGTYWSHFGQIVILILIQLGGLGYMTMASIILLFLRRKITLEDRLAIKESMDQFSLSSLMHFIVQVCKATLLIEAVGAAILFFCWAGKLGAANAFYNAVFNSISAFCNAGFSLFSNNLENYRGNIAVNITMMFLIVTGGLGYNVIRDIYHRWSKGKRKHFYLHTKSVLIMTAILIISGAVLIFIFESINPSVFNTLTLKEKILVSFFQSVTPRTAGFNTLPIGQFSVQTLFLLIIFMFIGASPGGTGGGIKTTTFLVLLSSTWALIRNKKDVEVFERRLPQDTILKAFAIFVIGLSLVVVITFFMLFSEGKGFMPVLFEVVSAFGTVGLSTGITPSLSVMGKLLLVMTMFVGRVGLLTFLAVFISTKQKLLYRYAEEKILVG